MSFSSGDFLNTIQSHDFEIQIPTALDMKANAAFNTAKKQQNKKRKADIVSFFTDSTHSENENFDFNHNTDHYFQQIITNLIIYLNKVIVTYIKKNVHVLF